MYFFSFPHYIWQNLKFFIHMPSPNILNLIMCWLQHLPLSSSDHKPAVRSSLKLTWLQMLDTISIDTCFLVHVTARWFAFLSGVCKWNFSCSYSTFLICKSVLPISTRRAKVFAFEVFVFSSPTFQRFPRWLRLGKFKWSFPAGGCMWANWLPCIKNDSLSEKKEIGITSSYCWLTDCPNSGLFWWRSLRTAGAVNESQNLRVGGFVSPKMDAFLPSANMVLPVK